MITGFVMFVIVGLLAGEAALHNAKLRRYVEELRAIPVRTTPRGNSGISTIGPVSGNRASGYLDRDFYPTSD